MLATGMASEEGIQVGNASSLAPCREEVLAAPLRRSQEALGLAEVPVRKD